MPKNAEGDSPAIAEDWRPANASANRSVAPIRRTERWRIEHEIAVSLIVVAQRAGTTGPADFKSAIP